MNRRSFLLGGASVPVVGIPSAPARTPVPFRQKGSVIAFDPSVSGAVEVSYSFGPGRLFMGDREVGRVTDVRVSRVGR